MFERKQGSRYAHTQSRKHVRRRSAFRKLCVEGLEARQLMAGDIGAGLSGYWAFNEAVGATAADSSTLGGNSGTLTNGPTHVTGKFEAGLHFDGVDDYVTLGSASSLPTSGEISISAWIKPESISGAHNIVAHGYDTNPNGEVFFRINGGQYQVGSWNGDNYYATATIPSEDIGNWVHLAGTYDGTTWRLYRNGTEVAASGASTGAVAVNASWAIGARGTGGERLFQGSIDEVRIYDRGLIADEVATLAAHMGQAPVAADLLYVASTALADDDVIGTVSVTDPDAGDTHTFVFASGNDAGGLAIDANGQITVADADALDFGTGNVLAFTVTATDNIGLSSTARVSIAKPAAFTVSGSSSATQNSLYMLTLDSSGIAGVTWTVNWGDGVTESTTGNTAGMGHLYQSPGTVTPTVTAALNGVTVTGLTPPAVAITQQPGVNLVRNGSFEADVVTHSANWQTFDSIAHWNIDRGPRIEVQKNVFGAGAEGSQYLELDGDLRVSPDSPVVLPNLASSRISQAVTVVAGDTYTLSFAYRPRPDELAEGENVLGVTVVGASVTIAPISMTEDAGWQIHTYTFIADSNSVVITFEDMADSEHNNGRGTLLDDVRLTKKEVFIDLDADVDNDGTIDDTDELLEGIDQGVVLLLNDDDDNNDGIPDFENVGSISGEDDLVELITRNVTGIDNVSLGVFSLSFDDTIVRIYETADRTSYLASGTAIQPGQSLFMEGIAGGSTAITWSWTAGGVSYSDVVYVTCKTPAAVDDVTYTLTGQGISIDVLRNDRGRGLAIDYVEVANEPAGGYGQITIANNKVGFTPRAGFYGIATYEYRIHDDRGRTAIARIKISVIDVFLSAYRLDVSEGNLVQIYADNATTTAGEITKAYSTEPKDTIKTQFKQDAFGVLLDLPAAFVRGSTPQVIATFRARGDLPPGLKSVPVKVILDGSDVAEPVTAAITVTSDVLKGNPSDEAVFTLKELENTVGRGFFNFDWSVSLSASPLVEKSLASTRTPYIRTFAVQATTADLQTYAGTVGGGLKPTVKRLSYAAGLVEGANEAGQIIDAIATEVMTGGHYTPGNSASGRGGNRPTIVTPWGALDNDAGGDCGSLATLTWEALDILGISDNRIEIRYVYPVSTSWEMGLGGNWTKNGQGQPKAVNPATGKLERLVYYAGGELNYWEATLYVPGELWEEPQLNKWWAGGVAKFEGNDNADVAARILVSVIGRNQDGSITRMGFESTPPDISDFAVPLPSIPDVIGLTPAEAEGELVKRGFKVFIDYELVPSPIPAGLIWTQSPAAGSDVVKNTVLSDDPLSPWNPNDTVVIRVSQGPM